MTAPTATLPAGGSTASRFDPRAWLRDHQGTLLAVVGVVVLLTSLRPPVELVSKGVAGGALYGLTAVALILVYRTHRIINFSAAALGAVPGVLAALLISKGTIPFVVGIPIATLGGALVGGALDVLVIRRFASASRLVLTVATLGLAQALAFVAIYVPIWLGTGATSSAVKTPFDRFKVHGFDRLLLTGSQVFAVVVVAGLCGGLALFFRASRVGIAMRAAAENADRALLLGVPVRLVQTVAWSVAGLFAGTTILLRSTLVGIPLDGSLGYSVLLYCLAAAVLARMERIGVAVAAGVYIGLIEQGAFTRTGKPDLTTAIMLVLVIAALVVQRRQLSRAVDGGLSATSATSVRGTPAVLAKLPEVVAFRVACAAVVAVIAIAAPYVVPEAKLGRLTLIPIAALVALSLVVLTGWAGQISLGQFGLVGVGSAIATGLAAGHNLDLFIVAVAGVAGGVVAAVLIGLPAIRTQGLYLAVTTLSFAGAAESWVLKKGYPVADAILPGEEGARIRRPHLWQRIDLENPRSFYFLVVVVLVVLAVAVSRFRRSRSGRMLLAVRDNSRAAPAYGVDVARARLAAFALSGGIAALAGVLLAYQQHTFDSPSAGVGPSVEIFSATIIGGVGSLGGALFGAVAVYVIKEFGENLVRHATLLATGPGLLIVLLVRPEGLGSLGLAARDRFLRGVARRHQIDVPSLTADRRQTSSEAAPDGPDAGEEPLEVASHHLDDVPLDHLVCPVCGEQVSVDAALDHEHFRPQVVA